MTWSTTTPTWPTSSSRPSTPPSPTGSCGAASSGCEHGHHNFDQGKGDPLGPPMTITIGKGDDPLGPPTTTTVINPATEQSIAEVELTDEAGTDELIAAAADAFPAWRDLAPG